jgi:hypothetical protein
MCELLSSIIQLELGDYNPNSHKPGYLSMLKSQTKLTREHEQTIAKLHKQQRGLPKSDTVSYFLDLAKQINMYGIFTFKGKVSYSFFFETHLDG